MTQPGAPVLRPPKGQVKCPPRPEHVAAFQWIRSNYEATEKGEVVIQKSDVYDEYERNCKERNLPVLTIADFGRILRSVFSKAGDRRIGARGSSKYCYTGITRKVSPQSVPSAEEVRNAEHSVVCEWASNMLNRRISCMPQLARYLVVNRFVQTRSASALTITALGASSDSNSGLEAPREDGNAPKVNSHRETQLKLQEKLRSRLSKRENSSEQSKQPGPSEQQSPPHTPQQGSQNPAKPSRGDQSLNSDSQRNSPVQVLPKIADSAFSSASTSPCTVAGNKDTSYIPQETHFNRSKSPRKAVLPVSFSSQNSVLGSYDPMLDDKNNGELSNLVQEVTQKLQRRQENSEQVPSALLEVWNDSENIFFSDSVSDVQNPAHEQVQQGPFAQHAEGTSQWRDNLARQRDFKSAPATPHFQTGNKHVFPMTQQTGSTSRPPSITQSIGVNQTLNDGTGRKSSEYNGNNYSNVATAGGSLRTTPFGHDSRYASVTGSSRNTPIHHRHQHALDPSALRASLAPYANRTCEPTPVHMDRHANAVTNMAGSQHGTGTRNTPVGEDFGSAVISGESSTTNAMGYHQQRRCSFASADITGGNMSVPRQDMYAQQQTQQQESWSNCGSVQSQYCELVPSCQTRPLQQQQRHIMPGCGNSLGVGNSNQGHMFDQGASLDMQSQQALGNQRGSAMTCSQAQGAHGSSVILGDVVHVSDQNQSQPASGYNSSSIPSTPVPYCSGNNMVSGRSYPIAPSYTSASNKVPSLPRYHMGSVQPDSDRPNSAHAVPQLFQPSSHDAFDASQDLQPICQSAEQQSGFNPICHQDGQSAASSRCTSIIADPYYEAASLGGPLAMDGRHQAISSAQRAVVLVSSANMNGFGGDLPIGDGQYAQSQGCISTIDGQMAHLSQPPTPIGHVAGNYSHPSTPIGHVAGQFSHPPTPVPYGAAQLTHQPTSGGQDPFSQPPTPIGPPQLSHPPTPVEFDSALPASSMQAMSSGLPQPSLVNANPYNAQLGLPHANNAQGVVSIQQQGEQCFVSAASLNTSAFIPISAAASQEPYGLSDSVVRSRGNGTVLTVAPLASEPTPMAKLLADYVNTSTPNNSMITDPGSVLDRQDSNQIITSPGVLQQQPEDPVLSHSSNNNSTHSKEARVLESISQGPNMDQVYNRLRMATRKSTVPCQDTLNMRSAPGAGSKANRRGDVSGSDNTNNISSMGSGVGMQGGALVSALLARRQVATIRVPIPRVGKSINADAMDPHGNPTSNEAATQSVKDNLSTRLSADNPLQRIPTGQSVTHQVSFSTETPPPNTPTGNFRPLTMPPNSTGPSPNPGVWPLGHVGTSESIVAPDVSHSSGVESTGINQSLAKLGDGLVAPVDHPLPTPAIAQHNGALLQKLLEAKLPHCIPQSVGHGKTSNGREQACASAAAAILLGSSRKRHRSNPPLPLNRTSLGPGKASTNVSLMSTSCTSASSVASCASDIGMSVMSPPLPPPIHPPKRRRQCSGETVHRMGSVQSQLTLPSQQLRPVQRHPIASSSISLPNNSMSVFSQQLEEPNGNSAGVKACENVYTGHFPTGSVSTGGKPCGVSLTNQASSIANGLLRSTDRSSGEPNSSNSPK